MINRLDIRQKNTWRIFGLILLFAFFGSPIRAQKPEIKTDSAIFQRTGNEDIIQPAQVVPDTTQAVDTLKSGNKKVNLINGNNLKHSPERAMYLGLACPGLGQIYNKKYFKVPIVYAALGGVGYWIHYNLKVYRTEIYNYNKNIPSTITFRSGDTDGIAYARRTLEISIISLAGVYGLQVLDAYVDAHLFYWDVDPDLTIKMEPAITPLQFQRSNALATYGLRFTMNF